MQQFYNQGLVNAHKADLGQSQKMFDELLSVALETIGKAKALHDELEKYYIPYIDFKSIDTCFEKTAARIIKS